jgi:hypothetical protein
MNRSFNAMDLIFADCAHLPFPNTSSSQWLASLDATPLADDSKASGFELAAEICKLKPQSFKFSAQLDDFGFERRDAFLA